MWVSPGRELASASKIRRLRRRKVSPGSGTVPPQKWMNFYTKVLSRFASYPGLTLEVSFRVAPGEEVTEAKIEEAKAALRELGLSEQTKTT